MDRSIPVSALPITHTEWGAITQKTAELVIARVLSFQAARALPVETIEGLHAAWLAAGMKTDAN